MIKRLYEHLITKKKYNTLELKYEMLLEQYDRKVVEISEIKKISKQQKQIWEETLKEQEEELIRLKKRKSKKIDKIEEQIYNYKCDVCVTTYLTSCTIAR